jgi:hypothetical protein
MIDCLKRMCWFRRFHRPHQISSAGVIFTNGNIMLCGFQPHKRVPCISGIGGKCNPGEEPIITALREMIEELFEIKQVSNEILWSLQSIVPKTQFVHHSYYITMYSFQDLHKMLHILYDLNIQSPLYTVMPLTLDDLIMKRKTDEVYCEISNLALLPIIGECNPSKIIDPFLIEDMRAILARRIKFTE